MVHFFISCYGFLSLVYHGLRQDVTPDLKIKEVLLSLSLLLLRSVHALQGVAITGVLDLRELVALVVVVAGS